MGKRKIFIDAERTRYPATGLYVYAQELGRQLAADKELSGEIDFYVFGLQRGVAGPGLRYRIRHWWDKYFMPMAGHYRVWHSLYQGTKYFPAAAATKYILTIHDLNYLYEEADRPEALAYNTARMQRLADRADTIVCISAYVADDVRRHLNVQGKDIRVIYNGTAIAYDKAVARPAVVPEKPFIFSIGAMGKKKNFKALLPLLQGNDMQLLVAGPTHDKLYAQELLAQAADMGLADRVILAGQVSEDDKIWYYRHCAAFCFVSIAEGFGLPVVEAMYFGKPIFISSHTSLPEIGGDAVYVFNSFTADDMRAVFTRGMADYAADGMAAKAAARRAVFTWQHAAEQYKVLYKKYL